MTTPAQDRNRDHLHQSFRTPFEQWLEAVRRAGYTLLVYETRRTHERQEYLYAQGRTRPGPIVTYTLDSAHLYGTAADMVPMVGGAPDWSPAAYHRIHQAVPPERYGLELLNFEKPHLQLKGGQDRARQLGLRPDSHIVSQWPLAAAPVVVPALPPKPAAPAEPTSPKTLPVRIFNPETNQPVSRGSLIVGTDKVYIVPNSQEKT